MGSKRNDAPLVHLMAGIVTAVSWTVAYHQPTFWTIVLYGLVAPLIVLCLGLRLARGSRSEADRIARNELAHLKPIDHSELPKRVQNLLFPREIVFGVYRQHPLALLRPSYWWMAGGMVMILIGLMGGLNGGQWVYALALIVIGCVPFGLRTWLWRRGELLITDQRLLRITGVIKTTVDMMNRNRVTDVKLIATIPSTILWWLRIINVRYGIIHVESAGQEQALSWLHFVPGVNEVWLLVQASSLEALQEALQDALLREANPYPPLD